VCWSYDALEKIGQSIEQLQGNGRAAHYSKLVYDPLLYEKLDDLTKYVSKHFPGYRAVADLVLVQGKLDARFAWHCDYYSTVYLEDPTAMVSLWFPLSGVTEGTGGRLMYMTSPDSHVLVRLETYG
jgi:hypothetical protein